MCVHWLTGDGLRREDGLRASVPARGGGFIATDRSVVCVRCCCVRSFLPENDRERFDVCAPPPVLPARAAPARAGRAGAERALEEPQPAASPPLALCSGQRQPPLPRARASRPNAGLYGSSLTHRAEGGSLSRPRQASSRHTTYDIWADGSQSRVCRRCRVRAHTCASPRLGLPGGRGRESEEESVATSPHRRGTCQTTGSSRSLLAPPGRLFRQLHPTGVRSGSPSPGRHRLAQAASRLCTGGRQCHRCHASGVLPPPPPPPLGVVLHLAFSEIQSRGGRSPGW